MCVFLCVVFRSLLSSLLCVVYLFFLSCCVDRLVFPFSVPFISLVYLQTREHGVAHCLTCTTALCCCFAVCCLCCVFFFIRSIFFSFFLLFQTSYIRLCSAVWCVYVCTRVRCVSVQRMCVVCVLVSAMRYTAAHGPLERQNSSENF